MSYYKSAFYYTVTPTVNVTVICSCSYVIESFSFSRKSIVVFVLSRVAAN